VGDCRAVRLPVIGKTRRLRRQIRQITHGSISTIDALDLGRVAELTSG
jgi:hypothetical protein